MTEPVLSRRAWLAGASALGSLTLWPGLLQASQPLAGSMAAAWAEQEQMYVGVLRLPERDGGPLTPVVAEQVPTRAHGMAPLRDGSVLFTSRRPGDWLLRLRPGQAAQWQWIEDDRAFNGHVIESADGRHLYTTETDLADSQGLIGVRDAVSLEKVAEWRTGGMDPHQLLLDHDGSLIVANGGIPTQPETGRRKLRLDQMDSSIARLLPQDQGRIAGSWKLSDPRLSLRHLAWGPSLAWDARRHWLGIALQAEHDDPASRRRAPVLALFDGQRLHPLELPAASADLAGYGGDIGCDGQRFAVSCPRANQISWWQPPSRAEADGQWVQATDFAGVYCIANPSVSLDAQGQPRPPQADLWMGGSAQARQLNRQQTLRQAALDHRELDNHWVPMPWEFVSGKAGG